MKIVSTTIPGCFEIIPNVFTDDRGSFVKTFHCDAFIQQGLEFDWREEFYSFSHKGVLRGLHFTLPPHDHTKLVYCVNGEAFDVVLDLRKGSPAFGGHVVFHLNAAVPRMIYIPKGCAHGFYSLSSKVIMMYKVTTVYAPDHDAGVLWNSVGISWPDDKPVMSTRDAKFPSFKNLKNNPLIYKVNT